jgi:hypothetical protein
LAPHFTLQLPADAVCGSALPLSLLNRATDPARSWSSALELRVGHGVNVVRFSDAAEAGIGNWVSTSLQGNAAWTQVTQDSHSPTHSWFVPDLNRRTDTVLVMEPLAALEPGAELRFFHKYRTENFRDGGVLEYSLDEGPWTDAGSLIRSGGYVALINAAASSNLAGRNAWAGDSAGWQEVVVDLSSFAGRTVRCRWRFATDLQNSSSGWAIDDITVRSLTFECQPVAVRPGEASGPGGAQFSITAVSDQTYQLQWSTPITGGAANRYLLYRYALPLGGSTLPSCEADLGSGTNATLTSLSANHGFVVVARNAAGEGSFGTTSTGAERPAATAPCP